MDWKETVTSISENVFPGISSKLDDKFYGNEVNSNLPLQMTLYFNVYLAPVWYIIIILFLGENVRLDTSMNTGCLFFTCTPLYTQYNELYKFIVITIIGTVFSIEALRLYLGYEGNLREKIPEFAGFWMLSVFIQFPLQTFLLFNPYFRFYVLEVCVQCFMVLLLTVQLASGYVALKYTAKQQATYFRIMKLRGDVTFNDVQARYKTRYS